MGLIFFNLSEQEVNVLLQNSEQSACDDYLFWAYRKLIETGSRVLAFVKRFFGYISFTRVKTFSNKKKLEISG